MANFFNLFISPVYFYKFSKYIYSVSFILAILLFFIGSYLALFVAPIDYKQGESYRIMFVHVPSAWLSMAIYLYMSILAFIYLVWRIKVVDIIIYSSSFVGASFTFLTLVTGSLWGKPMWGTWWVWDARLTSELILLFFYFGYISLYNSIENEKSASKMGCILLLVGVVNLPIIHYSVIWWNTLHQGPSILKMSAPSIHTDMLSPLFILFFSFFFFYIGITIFKARNILLWRQQESFWVRDIIQKNV